MLKKHKKIAAIAITLIIFSITFASVYSYWQNIPPKANASALPQGATGANANQPVGPYSYLIGQWSNGTYYAQNGTTGLISWSSPDATVLINTAISNLSSNGKIIIASGNYVLDNLTAITDAATPNIIIQGEDNPILISPNGFNNNVFSILASNVTIKGFTVESTGQNSYFLNAGINIEPSALNCSVQQNTIVGATTGIMVCGNYTNVFNNVIQNSLKDGITIGGGNYSNTNSLGGQGISIVDNFVKTSSIYNGISQVASINCIVSENTVINPHANGYALENLGYGPCFNDTLSNNQVSEPQTGNGIIIYSAVNNIPSAINCQFIGNQISNTPEHGVCIYSGSDVQFTSTQISSVSQYGVYIRGNITGFQFTGLNINGARDGIALLNGTNIQFGNIFINNTSNIGIYTVNGTDINFNGYTVNLAGSNSVYIDNPSVSETFSNGLITNNLGNSSIYETGTNTANIDFETATISNTLSGDTSAEFLAGNNIYYRNGFIINQAGTSPEIIFGGTVANWKCDGNTLMNGTGTGIYISTSGNAGSISNNILSTTTGYVHAVWLAGSGGDILIQNNKIAFSGTSSVAIYNQGTNTGTNYDTIANNDLRLSTVSITDQNQNYTKILNNVGYNPKGLISNPISGRGGSYIVDSGTASTWVSGTTYTNSESPKILYIYGGTVSTIKVDGSTIATATTSTPVTVNLGYGDTFSVTFSSAPTIQVFGQ